MSINKPNQQYPSTPTSTGPFMPPLIPDPSIRGESWDQILKNRGIRFFHEKALPCPNLKSLNTNAHLPDCQFCTNDGFIYYDKREIWGTFLGNNQQKTFEYTGIWEIGNATITFPTEYPDGKQADFNTFDRLTIPDFETRMWQQLEYVPTNSNQQKLRYPIIRVDRMVSIRNNIERVWTEGVDFNIVNGQIEWIPGNLPQYNSTSQVGEVFSISFITNPVFLVLQSLRELRISQQYINGEKIATRLPQQVLVRREFLVNRSNLLPPAGP